MTIEFPFTYEVGVGDACCACIECFAIITPDRHGRAPGAATVDWTVDEIAVEAVRDGSFFRVTLPEDHRLHDDILLYFLTNYRSRVDDAWAADQAAAGRVAS